MKITTFISNQIKWLLGMWQKLSANLLINLCGKLTLVITLMEIVLIVLFWKKFPPEVPLWFSRPWGEERLANPWWLFILPIANLGFFILNFVLAAYSVQDHPIFTRILFLTLLLVNLLSLIILINILLLVF